MSLVPVGYRIEQLDDLACSDRQRRLEAFVADIYEPSFPRAEHRDDPAVWRELLEQRPPPPSPLLAMREDAVKGGLVLEYFRRSRCGLLTYVAVAPQERGHGLGKCLLKSAVDALDRLAATEGHPPPPLFAETENPRSIEDDTLKARKRQQVLGALGILACDLPYLQPPLREGEPPSRGLQLCALASTLDGGNSLPAPRLLSFLQDFYASLPAVGTASEKALGAMQEWLGSRDRVRFHPFADGPGEA